MRYNFDADLTKIRATVSALGISDYSPYNIWAGANIEDALRLEWYRAAAENQGVDWRMTVFDAKVLLSGYHYLSSQTTAVTEDEVVYTIAGHAGGGTEAYYYKRIDSDLSSTDLTAIDFSVTANWTDVSADRSDQLKDLAAYQALFLIYRYLAKDTTEGDAFSAQRDYFDTLYREEKQRLILQDGINYDWNASDSIDDTEKKMTRRQRRLKR